MCPVKSEVLDAPDRGRVPAREDVVGVCGLVLAAGEGSRFGSVKQLAPLGTRPLLEHALAAMAEACIAKFTVVLGAWAGKILANVDLHGAGTALCLDWREGQAASLRTGVAALREADAVVVTLGDQPLISAPAIDRVVGFRSGAADGVRASYGGQPGHPILLERSLLESVPDLCGDVGARELLADAELVEVPCEDVSDATDVDTPSRLAELEKRMERPARRSVA